MRSSPVWLAAATAALVLVGCNGATSTQTADGHYTIQLKAFGSPLKHRLVAEQFKQHTEKDTGWKGLFAYPEKDKTQLCWGRYSRIEDAQKNLRKAKRYKAHNDKTVYAMALVIAMPGQDVGPPEWKLQGAKGLYSVLVAVFYDVPDQDYIGRERFAVEYCRQLRKRGLEAYYYHGTTTSAVAVGAFPEAAIRVSRDPGVQKRTIVNREMKRIIDRVNRLAVNGREQRILFSTKKERKFTFKKLMTLDKNTRDHFLRGRSVGYQRPYPIVIPGRKRSDDPRPHRAGYPQSR